MLCQKLCHNNVSGWGSIEESTVFFLATPDPQPTMGCINLIWG